MYERALSDYMIARGEGDDYVMVEGYGAISGACVAHADESARVAKAEAMDIDGTYIRANTAIYYEDGVAVDTIVESGEESQDVGLQ